MPGSRIPATDKAELSGSASPTPLPFSPNSPFFLLLPALSPSPQSASSSPSPSSCSWRSRAVETKDASKEIKMQALPTSPMAVFSSYRYPTRVFAPICVSGSSSFIFLRFSANPSRGLALRAVKGAQRGRVGSSSGPLRRPVGSSQQEDESEEEDGLGGRRPRGEDSGEGDEQGRDVVVGEEGRGSSRRRRPDWVDWEDRILQDTVPLVSFVRMILHSGKYESGDRLSPEHEKMILERLLPYHPECESKIGCGVDFITVGYHPDFESSRCLFLVRKDGEVVDFSYWKCIKGLIRKKYPLYADSFILRHFRKRRQQ
ncbi:DCL-like protein [Wolffia australiana]